MSTGRSMAKAAGFLMVAALISRLLGLVRDMLFAAWFGQTHVTDAYNAAFTIPDLIYTLMVGGALSSAFIPVFTSYLARKQEEEAWKVASIVFNVTTVILLALILMAEIFTRPLIMLLVPDLPAEQISLAVTLTRVMFIQTFFMALNGFSLGILNSKEHFVSPALGSIMYNVGIIGFGLALSSRFGIMGFAVGVVAGSILNLAVQIPALRRMNIRYFPLFDVSHPGFKEIMTLMLPVLIGLSVTQINLMVTQNLASGLTEGSITALRLAQRIMQFPVGIFGVSLAMAVFPAMNLQAARLEMRQFKRTFSLGLRAIFLVTIPAGAGLIALAEVIIRLFFQQGKFLPSDTAATAGTLLFFSLGLFAYGALQLLNRVFYALKDTWTPVIAGVTAIILNLVLAHFLIPYLQAGGLALAYSLAGIFNLLLLILVLRWRTGAFNGGLILKTIVISTGASVVMYGAVRLVAEYLLAVLPFVVKVNDLITLLVCMGCGVLIYGLIVLWFSLEEVQLVLGIIKKRFPLFRFRA